MQTFEDLEIYFIDANLLCKIMMRASALPLQKVSSDHRPEPHQGQPCNRARQTRYFNVKTSGLQFTDISSIEAKSKYRSIHYASSTQEWLAIKATLNSIKST
jgi:hypothetical protein